MDFKKTFLKFTQWTVPHGFEETVTHLLPKGMEKDDVGNYRISIGQSETLFTAHLDTVSTRMKINHVIQGDIIRTDGNSILGGDNKAGVCILMYLIEQQVPGTYYFFVGEETGCIGSRWALKNDPDYFKKFKRAIAFDRKKTGSVITKQRGSICASSDFADCLAKEYVKNGLTYNPDDTGVYTDTAVFMGIIPECTNISSAVWGEHTKEEYVNIKLIEQIAHASAKINWELLPTKRLPKDEEKEKKKVHTNAYYDDYDYGYGRNGNGKKVSNVNNNVNNNYNQSNYQSNYNKNITTKTTTDDIDSFIDGGNIEYKVENIPLFFDLTKVNIDNETGYQTFADPDGNTWSITINSDTLSIAKELSNGRPDVVFHEAMVSNIPTNFNQLWEKIKNVVTFKRKKKKNKIAEVKTVSRNLTIITPMNILFSDIEGITHNDTRIKGISLISTGHTTDGERKFFEFVINFDKNLAYEIVTNILESTIEKFKKKLGALVNTKGVIGKGKQLSMYEKTLSVEDFDKIFDVEKVKLDDNDTVFTQRFKDKNGNIYSLDIESHVISFFLVNPPTPVNTDEAKKTAYKLIFHGTPKTWDEFYKVVQDKFMKEGYIPFKKRNHTEYNSQNFDKVFSLLKIHNPKAPNYDFFRDEKSRLWSFEINEAGDTSVFLNKEGNFIPNRGMFIIRIENVKSYEDFIQKILNNIRSIDPYEFNYLKQLIESKNNKRNLLGHTDEEEEEDDDNDD